MQVKSRGGPPFREEARHYDLISAAGWLSAFVFLAHSRQLSRRARGLAARRKLPLLVLVPLPPLAVM